MWSEAELHDVWYGKQPPSLIMRMLEPIYRAVTALHRGMWQSGLKSPQRLPVPVLVVGNITAGGTGKTPLTIALVRALTERGWQPGVVSRGHGGSERQPVLLPEQPEPERFGDEPCLMRQAGCPWVSIGRDRPAAARLLVEAGADVVIADDGLQHYALARDLEICVVDGQRRLGNGRLLPAGPLREPAARLASVDWRIVNGGQTRDDEVAMLLEGDQAVALEGNQFKPLDAFAGQRAHAVAGIGNPQRFFATLQAQGLDIVAHPFPDHHAFCADDFDFGDKLPVLMTDKDAVKCTGLGLPHAWRVPVRARLPAAFLDQLEQRLRAI